MRLERTWFHRHAQPRSSQRLKITLPTLSHTATDSTAPERHLFGSTLDPTLPAVEDIPASDKMCLTNHLTADSVCI
eukprot:g61763.t1